MHGALLSSIGGGAGVRDFIITAGATTLGYLQVQYNTNINSEVDDKIQLLDLTIHKKKHNMTFNMYRKPTETDTTINYHSNHPTEQKMAA